MPAASPPTEPMASPQGGSPPVRDLFPISSEGGFDRRLLTFCRLLRRLGLKVTTGRILDLFRSLDHIDPTEKEALYYTARANLVSSHEEMAIFDTLFRAFWRYQLEEEEARGLPSQSEEEAEELVLGQLLTDKGEGEREEDGDSSEGKEEEILDEGEEEAAGEEEDILLSYSPMEVLAKKDFSSFSPDEIPQMRRLIAKLVPKLATRLSRRKRRHPRRGSLDLRRTLRKNMRHGGEILRLLRRRRRIRKTKVVLLCDVSGSMDAYSHFLIQFLYSLQHQLPHLRTFVFSTRLTEATPFLRHKDIHSALSHLAEEVHDWSGGTQIGNCLKAFNYRHGKQLVNSRTVLLIISDGWDRGDVEILADEMARLKSRCQKLIWLNPLLGSPGYRPIDRGMRTVLPYLDQFLPVHNLESLIQVVKLLRAE